MVVGKKPHDTLFPFSKTINFGLLSLGSYLERKGHAVRILDYRDYSTENNIKRIKENINATEPKMIGLSCISGFSFPNLLKFSRSIKSSFPDIPIIAGGKDHIGLFAGQLLKECKDIDVVVMGEGEQVVHLLLKHLDSGESYYDIPNIYFRDNECVTGSNPKKRPTSMKLFPFNYDLYPEIETYPPSIEISRGCPFNCSFCVSSRTKVRKKPIGVIIDEIKKLCKLYNNGNLKLYFETPNMVFLNSEIDELIEFRQKENLTFTYRTETRIEYLLSHSIEKLAESGLKVIDIGLESGSETILKRMNKTNRPKLYLKSAENILKRAYDLDIIIKINILFYVGENKHTIGETLSFLDRNEPYIRSISAYPLIGFQFHKFGDEFHNDLARYGGSVVKNEYWKNMKLFPINPSSEYCYDDLQNISLMITKAYQSESDFFYQKQYGYFSPKISFLEFRKATQLHNQEELPFFRTDEEKIEERKLLHKILH